MKQSEIWRNVEGYGDFAHALYLVSDLGNVKRSDGFIPHQSRDKDGYLRVAISVQPKCYKTVKVHRLVAFAFCENKEGKPVVDHIDADVTNNRATNLRWATVQENNSTERVKTFRREAMLAHNPSKKGEDAIWYGRHHTAESKAKISRANKGRKQSKEAKEAKRNRMLGKRFDANLKPVNQYTLNGEFVKRWESVVDAIRALRLGGSIYRCATGQYKHAYGYIWRYAI